ncbi:hypothetical protein ACWCWD_22680 [Streptomyces sp. NPDC001493]
MITQYYVKTPTGRVRVPYIAPYEGETPDLRNLMWQPGSGPGSGFRYSDETGADRDRGVLCTRQLRARGIGSPELAGIHSPRQRKTMATLSCQICGTDTDEDFTAFGERYLFLSSRTTPLTEGARTASPPVHRACALEALADCPRLRAGAHLALVKAPFPWGVVGLVHHATTGAPIAERSVEYGDERLRHTIALRTVVALHGCSPITAHDLKN